MTTATHPVKRVHRCPKCLRMWVTEIDRNVAFITQCDICGYEYEVRADSPLIIPPDYGAGDWGLLPLMVLVGVFVCGVVALLLFGGT